MFERYVATVRRGRPSFGRVTLRRDGHFAFSTKCADKYGLSRFSHVVLYWDAEGNRVGFQFSLDSEEAGSYRLGHVGRAGLSVCGVAFCSHFGIDYSVAQQFVPSWDEGLLAIDLKKSGGGKNA